jgi:hypothetical protein
MRRDACLGRYREFPKFPESKTPEGKGASAIKRLANDLVRFGKITNLKDLSLRLGSGLGRTLGAQPKLSS